MGKDTGWLDRHFGGEENRRVDLFIVMESIVDDGAMTSLVSLFIAEWMRRSSLSVVG